MRPRHTILLAAAIVYVVAAYVPLGHFALYPLTLFTTWVHEMGHGLTALAVGGRFVKLDIYGDASGLAWSFAQPGWPSAAVAAGGLLAPPIVGAVLIAAVHGPRRARVALALLAAALVASLAIYVRSVTGWIAMPIVAAGLGYAAWRGLGGSPHRRVVLVQVLGVVLALDTLTRMVHYVFEDEVVIDGVKRPSDIHAVAAGLGDSYLLWGCVVTVIAVGLLALAMWWAWRRPEPAQAGRVSSGRRTAR